MRLRVAVLVVLSLAALTPATPAETVVTTLAHALPDPLTMADGTPVTTAQQWLTQRKPELRALFAEHMYGQAPPAPTNLTATERASDPDYLGGLATVREIVLRFGPAGAPPINLLVATPNARRGPAPCFVGINFCGNHTICGSPAVAVPTAWVPARSPGASGNAATERGRMGEWQTFPIELIVRRGYGLACFYVGDIDPDRNDSTDGIQPYFPGATWGTIAAWAWGISRAVDYLVTDPEIDAGRLAVVGHSRNGKTALVAAAYDDRLALAIPCQAGCGGTAPNRGKVGESVKRINTVFPHWFAARFKEYNDAPEKLPFDQHELIALCAPRPVLLPNAAEDLWANPVGQFEMLQAADKVYRLLGVDGLAARVVPPLGKLVDSRLGYFIRAGKHAMDLRDWPAFLDYADRWLPAPGRETAARRSSLW